MKNAKEYYATILGPHLSEYKGEEAGIDMVDPTPYPTLAEIVEKYQRGERIKGLPGYYDDGVPDEAIPRNIDLSDIEQAQKVIQDASKQPIKKRVEKPVDPSPTTPPVEPVTPQE